jgi:hypothetical protein
VSAPASWIEVSCGPTPRVVRIILYPMAIGLIIIGLHRRQASFDPPALA